MTRATTALAILGILSGCKGKTEEVCDGTLPPASQVVRLTHSQYDHVASDLLGTEVVPADGFIPDPAFAGFTNNAEGLQVSERLTRDYRRAAEALAEQAVTDSSIWSRIVPCTTADQACAQAFITDFGRKVYRRPLTLDEIDRYVALWSTGQGLYASGTPFEQGIRLVIEGMLQSPWFLYRTELTTGEGAVPLSDHELAAKLALFLWDGLPDEELAAAADAGSLDVEAEARRMLDDPRAARPVDEFHRQWLELEGYEDLTRYDADFDADLGLLMQEETQAFVRSVFLDWDGTYEMLLTEPVTFVSDDLAPFYGLSATLGDTPVEVDLDPDERAGLLTQLGFLAANAYPGESSPIHRGVFIQRKMLCVEIPDPPSDVDPGDLPERTEEIVTTRDQVEVLTSSTPCSDCHDHINPAGFAFEHYDAVGRYRTEDNGAPVDASATLYTPEGDLSYTDAVEFSHELAASPVAQRCYLTQWYRYGLQREEGRLDECSIDAIDLDLAEGGYGLQDLLVALTTTPAFTHRQGGN